MEPALELRKTLEGETVMRTRYCVRREMGECLKEGTKLRGGLRLERGNTRYRLDFDCAACEMTVTAAADSPVSSLRTKCNEVKQSS
jgi:putative protease